MTHEMMLSMTNSDLRQTTGVCEDRCLIKRLFRNLR